MPINQVRLEFTFYEDGEKKEWDYYYLITDEDISEYYGKPIHKDLFPFIDFERLVEDDESFRSFIMKKCEDDAREECRKYYL